MTGALKKSKARVPSVASEFSGAELGDGRRTKRLEKIAEAFSAAPDRSLPKIARDAAELEAFYRFFENDAFGLDELVLPHARATAERALDYETVLAIHDLTEFSFPFEDHLREGCQRLGGRQGFFGEVSLAVAGDGSRKPLGVLGCRTWTKSELPPRVRPNQKSSPKRASHTCGRCEGTRWAEFASQSDELVGGPGRLVHVMDREADGFPLFNLLLQQKRRFVIRITSQRVVELVEENKRANVVEAATRFEAVHEVDVPISRRREKPGFRDRPRDARKARLTFRAATVVLRRPNNYKAADFPATLKLNLVWALEEGAPDGTEPIEWILGTTEPIATVDDVIRIVDFYRARWVIEEFFRALKSGCAFERRQLESRGALQKVLAISLVVAWRVLLLRHESRRKPDGPATAALSELQIEILKRTGRLTLPRKPTARQALLAVAALGGHIKNNGEPGLIVLARGMESLLERAVGWISALAALGIDGEM